MNHVWLLLLIIHVPCVVTKVKNNGYYPVSVCPKDANEWEASSRRLKCNNTHNYHCAPYHDQSQLYEFCYGMAVLKVEKGNCIGIAESGILNFDRCHFFAQGCPDKVYNSNEIYKYPSCLSIQEHCYTEDCVCKCLTTATKPNYRNDVYPYAEQNKNPYLIPFAISCIISVISIVLNVLQFIRSLGLRKADVPDAQHPNPEEEKLLEKNVLDAYIPNPEEKDIFEKNSIYEKTLVEYTIEDAELFEQLKQQCLYGAFEGFEYLVRSRIQPKKKEDIFRQCDENGCILLHYAAQGGSILIIEEIIKNTSDDILEHKCIRGQNALHFAMRYKKRKMTMNLFKKYANLKNSSFVAKERQKNAMGEFSPIHWVAWYGDEHMLRICKTCNFDIATKTRNGLNILDIACMSEEIKEQYNFCRHLLENESNKIDPRKTDSSGWNIAHYASMCNARLFEFISGEKNISDLVTIKTKSEKTCLHIACQSAKFEIVKHIVEKIPPIDIKCKDELGWNALHFAAKGGDLNILKYLLEKGLKLGSLTNDGKTILHIACYHKHVDISKYAVENFSKDLLNQRNVHKMTAAHYLGVQCKASADESAKTILKILCESEMDLATLSSDGFTVLQKAIDHSNTEFIGCLISNEDFRIKCGITEESLIKGIEQTDNDDVKDVLKELHIVLKKAKKQGEKK